MTKKQINLLGEDVEPDRVKNHFFDINLNKMDEVSLRKLVIEELRKHKSIIAFSESDSFEKIELFLKRWTEGKNFPHYSLVRWFFDYVEGVRNRKNPTNYTILDSWYLEKILRSHASMFEQVLKGYFSTNDKELLQQMRWCLEVIAIESDDVNIWAHKKLQKGKNLEYLKSYLEKKRFSIRFAQTKIVVNSYYYDYNIVINFAKLISDQAYNDPLFTKFRRKYFTKSLNKKLKQEISYTYRLGKNYRFFS